MYFGPTKPNGVDPKSWIKTLNRKAFLVAIRLYGSGTEFYDQTWNPPCCREIGRGRKGIAVGNSGRGRAPAEQPRGLYPRARIWLRRRARPPVPAPRGRSRGAPRDATTPHPYGSAGTCSSRARPF